MICYMWTLLDNVIYGNGKIFDLFNGVSSFMSNQLAKPFFQNVFTGHSIKV